MYSLNTTQYKNEKASRHAARSCPAHHCTFWFVRVGKGKFGIRDPYEYEGEESTNKEDQG